MLGDPFRPLGGKSIHGIEVNTDDRVPPDVLVFEKAGKMVKVVALTEEAKGAAEAYAAVRFMSVQRELLFNFDVA